MAKNASPDETIDLNHPSPPYNERAVMIDEPPPAYQYPNIEVSSGCKNPVFAVIFWIHTIIVIGLGLVFGIPALMYYVKNYTRDEQSQAATLDFNVELFICIFLGSAAIGGVTAMVAFFILQNCAGRVIKCSLIMTIMMLIASCVGLFYVHRPASIVPFIILVFTFYYFRSIVDRIPFAEAHLQVGCAALRSRPSLILVAIGMLFVQLLWIFFWSMMALGIGHAINTHYTSTDVSVATYPTYAESTYLINEKSNRITTKPSFLDTTTLKTGSQKKKLVLTERHHTGGIVTFILLVSFYWGAVTFRNVVHFITACSVGQWWFETGTKGQYALSTSIKRAFTTNFGTISFGSLLVAIVKALRTLAKRDNARGNVISCVTSCIANCILYILEEALEYLNEWAFIYAALTGQGFIDSGKSFMGLFKERGWTMIINDNLIGTALSLVTFIAGLISAISGGLAVYLFMQDSQHRMTVTTIAAGLSFIMGISMCTVITALLSSSVRTAFVCFALNPAALGSTHPEYLTNLINAWQKFHPEEYVASGYAQHLPPPSYTESLV